MEQSSAAAAVDPDRLTIRYFENGGAHPQLEDIAIVRAGRGGAHTKRDGWDQVAGEAASDDKRCATFSIKHEDHTLGNALRHIIIRKYTFFIRAAILIRRGASPDVDFCGYSIPHPSEDKIHLRIQSRGTLYALARTGHLDTILRMIGPPAIDILRKGLDDLQAVMETLLEKFDAAVARRDYEHHADLEI